MTDTKESGTLTVNVRNVTHTRRLEATFDGAMPAAKAAAALASRLNLPANVPYSLRSNRTAAFLDDAAPLQSQVEPNESLTLTPRSHLG